MSFRSILFEDGGPNHLATAEPDCYSDLHLDQIVTGITVGLDEFDLKPFFYTPLWKIESIEYRQEVMRALEERNLRESLTAFGTSMRRMREQIAESERLTYRHQTACYFLDAVNTYTDAVEALERALAATTLSARGLKSLHDYLCAYSQSVDFRLLVADTKKLAAAIAGITYTLDIQGLRVTVRRYNGEADYGQEVLETFEKFRQGRAADYTFSFPSGSRLTQVEEAILDRVAMLHPEIFAGLADYRARHQNYLDDIVRSFDREIYFYTSYLRYIEAFKAAGLSFCYPTMSTNPSNSFAHELFDVSLAARLIKEKKKRPVGNDFELRTDERVIVVSGANQGGKTTYARAVGQLHHLALLGCPVPARESRIFLIDRIFTHFEREEDLENLTGKLELDLNRIHEVLAEATSQSLLIMNETFSSTALADALFLSRKVLSMVLERGLICVTVTFFDELAGEPRVVSMVAGVDETDHAARTFKLTRRTADGRAYAATLARKYRLTSADLKARLPA
jgi:DNA mismatch repair protein MutS